MSSNSINLCPFFTSKFGIIVAGGDHVALGKNSYGKGTSINKLHRSYRSKLDSSAWFRFIDKDSPEYQLIKYGRSSEYSERQKKILSEEIPLEQVRLNELSRLANKAKTFGDMETYNIHLKYLTSKGLSLHMRTLCTERQCNRCLRSLFFISVLNV